jgi:hypothetical protein
MALIINEETVENQVLHEAKSNCAKADGTSLFSKQPQKKTYKQNPMLFRNQVHI